MKLSKYFTLEEMISSDYAIRNNIDNTPSDTVINNLRILCLDILDPLREHINMPIIVSSGYRSPELNRLIGGATTSQHVFGQAADIIVHGLSPKQILSEVIDCALDFDQAILEFDRWLHISYVGKGNRHSKLRAYKKDGLTIYDKI